LTCCPVATRTVSQDAIRQDKYYQAATTCWSSLHIPWAVARRQCGRSRSGSS